MKILLDTCTFLWLVAAPDRLSAPAAAAIDADDAELLLSDCSVWELCLKWKAGKIALPQPPRIWVEQQMREWALGRVAIERSHLYRVVELPQHHRDPFDHLLTAQAIELGLTIATPDPHIHRYPVAVLW